MSKIFLSVYSLSKNTYLCSCCLLIFLMWPYKVNTCIDQSHSLQVIESQSRPTKSFWFFHLLLTFFDSFNFWNEAQFFMSIHKIRDCFIYILDSSNSSSITFRTNQFSSSSRSNWTVSWTGSWTGSSTGSWTDKQSSHFSTAKEMSVKAIFLFR